ncbi:MAG TPA: type II secretion system protein M [Steroidobacteraceae bacterium]|jgi:general secretion pathway protein M|nr:type II secretion system protein M [Steroidobacteraceae bacterium]
MQKLKDWFYGLKPRERAIVLGGAILVGLTAIYILALAPFYNNVATLSESVEQKKADLAWMRSVAGEMQVLGANQPMIATPTDESLVVLVDRTAREAGLSSALTGQTPNGETGIRVRLESAAFDMAMMWLANLELSHAVAIESATFDRTSTPGLVNVSLVLNRAAG